MNLVTLQAMSDAELNELSAVKVMGWIKDEDENYYEGIDGRGCWDWNPTIDMNDAMELCDNVRDREISITKAPYYDVDMWIVILSQFKTDDEGHIDIINKILVEDKSLPKTITIASILSKESE